MIKRSFKSFFPPIVKDLSIVAIEAYSSFIGKKKIQTIYPITIINNKNSDTYFGYYDISPFRKNDILYNIKPNNKNYLDIAINNLEGTNQIIVSRTKAWNWQQGCRLRWYPSDNRIISYNDFFNDHGYKNIIMNIDTYQKKVIDYPLYDIDKIGKIGLSIDFERLGRLRPGYGYTINGLDMMPLKDHGIDLINIEKNEIFFTLTYERIISHLKRNVVLENCYLNHLSFSPDNKKFLFFLIEIIDGYHMAYLFVYDIQNDYVIVLDEEEKVSHYVWKDNNSIICTVYSNPSTCKYYSYNIKTCSKELLAPKSLCRDGHPSMLNERNVLLTDTYPDSIYFQHLMKVDIDEDKIIKLANIYSNPRIGGEMRTDLHPRINDTQDYISFDANVKNKRNFYILKIK